MGMKKCSMCFGEGFIETAKDNEEGYNKEKCPKCGGVGRVSSGKSRQAGFMFLGMIVFIFLMCLVFMKFFDSMQKRQKRIHAEKVAAFTLKARERADREQA